MRFRSFAPILWMCGLGCAGPVLRTVAPQCASAAAAPAVAADLQFAGAWDVFLTGKRGQARGRLVLRPFDSLETRIRALPPTERSNTSTLRFVGTWRGTLQGLSVRDPDSPESMDPIRPGVRLDAYRRPATPWLIQFGAAGNDVRYLTLDRYSFHLVVTGGSGQIMGGPWRYQAEGMGEMKDGRWCALRIP